jgi:FkbM family methyltransferase
MSVEEILIALYGAFLGRAPDPAGLAHWASVIGSSGDPTRALRGILDSEEYKKRTARPNCTREIQEALSGIQRPLRIVDIGARSLGAGTHPYDRLLQFCESEIVGFDPLEARLKERAAAESNSRLTLLPFAIGDGEKHTFYVANEDASSSIFPLDLEHNSFFNHISGLRTVSTVEVTTRRVDDVLAPGPVDFLKLDVQGAELMALRGVEHTLANTAVVHCEVMFSPMYVGEPLFCDIQAFLASRNFEFIDFAASCHYHYLTSSGREAKDRLIWADAVYFRKSDVSEVRSVQALIAASVYEKPTLAEHLLTAQR